MQKLNDNPTENTQSNQPREKTLPVMEVFGPTIQGEGIVAGTQTHFIRFGLCDYKCTMCDSMHAVDPVSVKNNAVWLTTDEIIEKVVALKSTAPWITLSGGNPAIHNLGPLVLGLRRLGYKIAVETQGTLAPAWLHMVNILTVSPKSPGMGERFEKMKYLDFIEQFQYHQGINIKIPVFTQIDLDFAVDIFQMTYPLIEKDDCFYLSLGNWNPPGLVHETEIVNGREVNKVPIDGVPLTIKLLENYRILLEDIQINPGLAFYRFLPQLHVLLWGNARGK